MTARWLVILLLPLLAFAGHAGWRMVELADATPVRLLAVGIDPRDPLVGRYLAYRIHPPVGGVDAAACAGAGADCRLCLPSADQSGPSPRFAWRLAPADASCALVLAVGPSGLRVEGDAKGIALYGRIYVDERMAGPLERELAGGAMVLEGQLARSGRFEARRFVADSRATRPHLPFDDGSAKD